MTSMTTVDFPPPPTAAELGALLAGPRSAAFWSRFLHFAATRGDLEDPLPILWVDALHGLDAASVGGPDPRDLAARLDAALDALAALPEFPLETAWLRRLPREDASLIYTGSLVDVLAPESLEEACARLARLLHTIVSPDYARELLRDAAAWDGGDAGLHGLRLADAVARHLSWKDRDPAVREGSRALLLRWLGALHARRPSLPARPPRGAAPPWSVAARLEAWAGSERPLRAEDIVALVTVGRVQTETRVLAASLREALAPRWGLLGTGAVGTSPCSRLGPAAQTRFTADILDADLAWVRQACAPHLAERLAAAVRETSEGRDAV